MAEFQPFRFMASSSNKTGFNMLIWVVAGFGISGFAIVIADLLRRLPGLGGIIEPFIQRFFPSVENGMAILLSSLLFVATAVAIHASRKKT